MGWFKKKPIEERADDTAVTTWLPRVNSSVTLALEIPIISRCVEMISSSVGALPVRLYCKSDEGVREITDDKRLILLNSTTGDTLNADEMRRQLVRDYLLYGNAYCVIEKRSNEIDKLLYVEPMAISVEKDTLSHVHKAYKYRIDGKAYNKNQILKFLRHSKGYGDGVGIVEENPLMIETMYQMLKFQKNQVLKGGNKKGFLKTTGVLSADAVAKTKEQWSKINSNENAETFMLLNGDIDFKEMSSTSVEMQLNENKNTNNSEMMKLFGTADGMLSADTIKNAIMPIIDTFEASYDADLLTEQERQDGYYFAFDTKELTRGDINSRFNAYAVALSNSFMQLDEVRELEDLPPMDFNYIKLGLQDVLLNPKTNQLYTPNTNKMVDFGTGEVDNGKNNDIIESRADDFERRHP